MSFQLYSDPFFPYIGRMVEMVMPWVMAMGVAAAPPALQVDWFPKSPQNASEIESFLAGDHPILREGNFFLRAGYTDQGLFVWIKGSFARPPVSIGEYGDDDPQLLKGDHLELALGVEGAPATYRVYVDTQGRWLDGTHTGEGPLKPAWNSGAEIFVAKDPSASSWRWSVLLPFAAMPVRPPSTKISLRCRWGAGDSLSQADWHPVRWQAVQKKYSGYVGGQYYQEGEPFSGLITDHAVWGDLVKHETEYRQGWQTKNTNVMKDGSKTESLYQEGLQIGHVEYYPNGQKRAEHFFPQGLKPGESPPLRKSWNPDGTLKEEVRNGRYFGPDGRPLAGEQESFPPGAQGGRFVMEYRDGWPVKETLWHPDNAHKKYENIWDHNVLTQKTEWDAAGTLLGVQDHPPTVQTLGEAEVTEVIQHETVWGLTLAKASAADLAPAKLSAALKVVKVQKDSPAGQAGFQAGDLLTQVEGRPVGEIQAFLRTLDHFAKGSQAKILVHRAGTTLTLILNIL